MLTKNELERFTLDIKDGYFCWKVILKDLNIHQIKYRIEKHKTPKGNYSKRKIYFIEVGNNKIDFDEEVKKIFTSFKRPYLISGI